MAKLVLVLGDQLDMASSAFDDFNPEHDAIWMAEVVEESTHVWSSKQRTTLFLSAMRHFAEALRARGWRVHYLRLDDERVPSATRASLSAALTDAIARWAPDSLVLTAPGDWRVLAAVRRVADGAGVALDLRDDRHFFSTVREFAAHAAGRKQLRMEYWYREQRKKTGVLMDGDAPIGGQWNFDHDNRASFGKGGPVAVPPRSQFAPDATTRAVMALVNERFADHPGTNASFAWPVTREQALAALDAFIRERLPQFGEHQDAMWSGETWLYHAHLASSLNLKLLNPREVVAAAQASFHAGLAPIASVEGFIRQILGWREYVRGIYWTQMPSYLNHNALDAREDLPSLYWTGKTEMACLADVVGHTLRDGYAHHIERLMVTGLYALLYGVEPQQVHQWYLAVYVDAVEWVEAPNTLGMSQYADGGLLASKPYAATGKYISRMSNHCRGCRFDPAEATGPRACPFTTLYWDFLLRHEALLSKNARMALQVRNIARLTPERRAEIRAAAAAHRREHAAATT